MDIQQLETRIQQLETRIARLEAGDRWVSIKDASGIFGCVPSQFYYHIQKCPDIFKEGDCWIWSMKPRKRRLIHVTRWEKAQHLYEHWQRQVDKRRRRPAEPEPIEAESPESINHELHLVRQAQQMDEYRRLQGDRRYGKPNQQEPIPTTMDNPQPTKPARLQYNKSVESSAQLQNELIELVQRHPGISTSQLFKKLNGRYSLTTVKRNIYLLRVDEVFAVSPSGQITIAPIN